MREVLMNGMGALLVTLALAELAWAWWSRQHVHRFRDTISSLSTGIGQQAINIYLSASFLAFYAWVHAHLSIMSADTGVWWHWLLFIPACDLCYYTAHRAMHTINFFVAAHIVHHQAEDYNHLSAMRQSWTAWIVVFPFFLTLAVAGVPLEMFVVGQLGIMFFQFLSHNGLFRGDLGIIDRIFVTPTNHRVHHGINGPYLGSNCGGMFVIWDRVFGTFVQEDPDIPIQMGTGMQVNFYDPFEANLDYYRRVVFAMRHRQGWRKLQIWWQSPEVLFEELDALGYDERAGAQRLERAELSSGARWAVGAVLLGCVASLALHRVGYPNNPMALRVLTGAVVFSALWMLGRLLSRPVTHPVAAK